MTATSDLDVLVIGPRQFEAMTDIPGFRKALLAGMSRRIRQADDRLAAYGELVDDREVDGHGETNAHRADGARDGETATDWIASSVRLGRALRQSVQPHDECGLLRQRVAERPLARLPPRADAAAASGPIRPPPPR